jgi:tetratricopeptide (TPR) repeat protein
MFRKLWVWCAAAVVVVAALLGLFFARSWWRPVDRSRASTAAGPIGDVARRASTGQPVIFVGLDAVDWDLLDPLMAAGAMPNLAALVRQSACGNLETLHPPLSPLVWTTMMTGVDPVRHGILDFLHLRPDTGDKEPITSTERRVPAIWNMATWAGKRVAVFGLWATYPAERVNGLMVSDRMFTFLYGEDTPPPGAVFPPEREQWARDIAARADHAIDFDLVRQFLPTMTQAEYEEATADPNPYSHPAAALRRILLETRIYADLSSAWIRAERPDLAVVYFQGTDSIGHVFAPFVPPKQPEVSPEDYARYQGVPRRYFHLIDALIGDYRKMAEDNHAALVITSDHGFAWGEGRPTTLSSFANATAAKWHRPQGMYLVWNGGAAGRAPARGQASVIETCPTLAALLGLPYATGTADKPFGGVAFPSTQQIDYSRFFVIPELPAGAPRSARDDRDKLNQLRALGYIGSAEPERVTPRGSGPGRTRTAGSYNNEGLVLKNQGRTEDAIAAFDKALEVEPKLASALWNLSDLLFADKRDLDRSDELLLRALDAGLPEATKYVVGRAIGYQRAGQVDRSLKLLEPATRIHPDVPDFWLFAGRYRVELGQCDVAVQQFTRAVQLEPQSAAAYGARALGRMCAGDRDGARADLQHSLSLDPSQARLREMLRDLNRGRTP